MPTFTLEEANFVPLPEEVWMAAELAECKLITKEYTDDSGNPIKKVLFKFVIVEPGRWEGQHVFGETPTRFNDHPDCKLRNWAQEISGTEFTAKGQELNTDVLLGMRCRISCAAREYEKDGEKKRHTFVKDVMRSREAMRTMASAYNEPF